METQRTSYAQRSLQEARWVPFGMVTLYAIIRTAVVVGKLGAPGAPTAFFLVATGVLVLVIVPTYPVIFWKLPPRLRVAVGVTVLLTGMIQNLAANGVSEAYEQTPHGARELAKSQAKERQAQREREARLSVEQAAKEAEESLELAAQHKRQLENCRSSWSGEIADLVKKVKDDLPNPRAFEHVGTDLIVAGPETGYVIMTYRAENVYSAIRTYSVRAKIELASCQVVSLGSPYES